MDDLFQSSMESGNIQAKVETFVRQFRTDNVRTKLSSLKQFLSIDRKSVHSSNPDVRQSSLTESSKNISSTNQTTITARAADAQYNPSTSHPLSDTIIAELDPKNPCGSLESSASDSSKGLDEINPNTNSTKSDARKGLNAEINPATDPNFISDASKVGLDAGINRECDTSKTVVRDSETNPNTEKIVGISATGSNPALETNRSNVKKIVGLTDLESKPSNKEVNKTIGTDAQLRPINSETKLSSDKNRLEKSQELSKTASNTKISQDKPNLGETNKHIANKTIDTFEELDIKPSAIFGVTSKDTPKPLVNSNRFLSETSEDNLNSEFVVKDELNGCDTDEDDYLKRLKSFVRNLSDKYRNFELSSTNTQSYSPSIESSPFNIELASPNIERSPFNIELVSPNIELSRDIELSHPTRFDFLLNLANIHEFDSREGLEILDTAVRLSIGFVDGLIRTAEEKVESDQKLESCSDLEGEAFKETHPQIGVHRESESAFGAKVFEEGTPFDSGFRRKSRDSAERILERSGLESRASDFHTERAANFKGNKFKLEEKKEEDPFESLYHEKLCDSERWLFTERQCIREANHETNEWTHEDDANEEIDSNEDLANENLDKAVRELNDFPVFALETGESHQFAPVEKNLNESGSGGVKASLKRAQFRSLDEFSLKFTRSLLNDWKNPLKRVFQRIQSEDSARGPLESSLVIGETTGLDQLESAGDSDGKGLNAERISADTNEPARFETCAHEGLTSKVDCSSDSSDNLANKAHSSHEFRAGIELESNITHKTAYGGINQTHCSKSDLNVYTSGEHFAPNVHQELAEAGSPFATIVGKKGSESAPLESVTSQATTNVSENQSRINQNAEITFAPSGPSVTSASNVVKSATMSLGSNHHDNEKDAPHHHGNEKDAPFHHGNEKDAPYHHGNEKDAPYHHGNEKDANHHGNEKDVPYHDGNKKDAPYQDGNKKDAPYHHGNEKDAPYGNRDPDTRGFTVPSVYVQTESSSAGEISRGGVEGERPAQLNLVPEIATSSPRNKSPVTVQEWVDSLPLETPPRVEEEPISPIVNIDNDQEHDTLTLGAEATFMCQNVSGGAACASPGAISVNNVPANCEVSDAGSHDSVDSFLEARKADPETILLNLGFGGSISNSSYSDTGRIPQRFLQPSKLNGIAIENFLKHQQLLVHSYESGLGGYRGLTGSAQTKSCIVQKIMEKLLDYERETSSLGSPSDSGLPTAKSLPPNGKVGTGAASPGTNRFSNAARNVLTKIKCVPPSSVLSPDNRKWLESQGDKSPEVARRMILGQTSYIFGQDGDLIESPASSCIGENDRALPRTLKTQGGPPHTSSSNHSSPNNSTLTSSSLSSPNLQSHNHTHSHNHHDRSHNHHSNNHHHGSYKEPLEFHPDHDRSRRPFTPSVASNSTSNLTNSTSSDYEGPQISSSDRFYKSVLQISHLNNIKFSMEYEDDVFARENSEVGDDGRIGEAHRRGFEEAHRSASESGSESGNRRFGEVQSENGNQSEGSGRRFKESNMRSVSESGSEASGRRFGEAHRLSGNSESGDERGGYILLNIDRRGEELSKSTETIVANGDSQGDGNNEAGVNNERTSVNNREVSLNKREVSVTNEEVSINNARAGVNMDANGNLSVGTVNSVNTADNGNINETTNDVLNRNNNRPDNPQNANGGFERSSSTTEVLGQESTDGVRQRPSIVINHCESIDMNAETADRTDANEQTYNGKARVAGSSEQDGNANTEGNDSQGNELGTNETQELNYRHNINTSEINPVPETSIEQSTLIRDIKKIDDNQNIVDNPPIGENKEVTAARVGPSSSMADLVYNLIVDKSDAIEPNVDNKTDSQNQLLNEIEMKTKPSDIEEDIVQRKNPSGERTNYDAAYETAHANIIVVSRNMKNIDDMNSKEHSEKMEKIASSVKDTRKEIVEAQNTVSDQLGNTENGSSVKESALDKMPSGSSIADLVYNMIVKATGPSSSADQTNEENSSTNPRIVLDTSDEVDKDDTRNERSPSSNTCDSGEASNTEAVNANETSNVDEASHGKPANHLNLASIMPSPLVTQIKRTSSAVSLRDELLESLGSIEHEKSPDLDDLLASIGPIRVENDEDYDEIYESDFEENQEIPVLRKQKKHQCRKKHADSHGSGLVDGHQCDGAKRRRTTDEVESENEDAKSDKEDSCHVCPTCHQRNQHYYNDPESIDRAFSPVNVDDDYVRGKRCCRMNHDSLATETHEPGGHEECRNCHRSDPNTDADISECCRTCYRPSIDYSMLDESCHIPVIKSIDKIITTLENVLEPLEQITDSATESEISCGYKRRGSGKSAGTAGPGHVENLNLLIAKLNHINGTELSSIAAGDFSALSNHEQCSLQCKILRQALATYLSQMSQQELHEELKSCLSLEVERVAELLNGNIDVGVLSRVVLQMTSLLHHQYQLNEQIRDLTHPSPSENNAPPASCCHSNPGVCCHGNDASFPSNAQSDALCCHGDQSVCCHNNRGLCCHSNILKRVQDLEQQVRRNARELEDMKRKLEEKLL